jgi:hypothetical protein
MGHLPVHRGGGERGANPPVVEPHRMRLDPFRQLAPFPTGGEALSTMTFSILPGDDPLGRWESEGGFAQ